MKLILLFVIFAAVMVAEAKPNYGKREAEPVNVPFTTVRPPGPFGKREAEAKPYYGYGWGKRSAEPYGYGWYGKREAEPGYGWYGKREAEPHYHGKRSAEPYGYGGWYGKREAEPGYGWYGKREAEPH